MVFVLDHSRKKKKSPACCHAQKNWRAPKSLQALQKSFAQQQPTRMLLTGSISGIQLCFSSCYWKGRWLLAQHRRVETLNAPKLASVLGSSPKGKTTQRSPGHWAGWGLVLPETPMEVQQWISNRHKSQKENSDYMEERNVFSMRATKY